MKTVVFKIATLLLAVAMTLALAACATQDNASGTSDASEITQISEPAASSASESSETQTEPEKLAAILDDIDASVEPGTAGSSLKSVPGAVALLDWAAQTGLDSAAVKDAVDDWLKGKDDDYRAAFADKLAVVRADCGILTGDDAETARALIESAGLDLSDTRSPWDKLPDGLLDGVWALLPADAE